MRPSSTRRPCRAVSITASPGRRGGDPLDPRTAYLYTKFVSGTLAGYDYTPSTGRIFSAKALQDVIWYIEDEQAKT